MFAPTRITNGGGARTLAPYEFDDKDPGNLNRRAVDHVRRIKVICIGAGFSGILTGILFPRSIENLDLVVYDKNAELGGTWYESRYPGVACDVPCHAYQYTFESNTQWSGYWAGGAEIQQYLLHTAHKYGANKYMRFSRLVEQAAWNEAEGQWHVTIKKLDTGEVR